MIWCLILLDCTGVGNKEIRRNCWYWYAQVTYDSWHMRVGSGGPSLNISAPWLLQFGSEGILKILRKRITEWVNSYKGVCRTAQGYTGSSDKNAYNRKTRQIKYYFFWSAQNLIFFLLFNFSRNPRPSWEASCTSLAWPGSRQTDCRGSSQGAVPGIHPPGGQFLERMCLSSYLSQVVQERVLLHLLNYLNLNNIWGRHKHLTK